MKKKIFSMFFLMTLFSINLFGEEKSMEELSKEISNPLAQIWNLSFMYNYQKMNYDVNLGDINIKGSEHMNVGVFQPVLPIPFGEYTFFARPVIPFIEGPTKVNSSLELTDRKIEIGDTMLPIGFGKVSKVGWSYGAGITFMLPTGQNEYLSSHQYEVGPTGLVLWANEDWTIGTHFQHWWGFEKASGFDKYNKQYGNHSDIQYFIVKNLPNAWQIRMSPHITVDWNADSGEQWTVPIGIGIGKMVKIGPMPVMLMAEYQYSVIAPKKVGNESIIMLQANFIIKNPFGSL